MTHTNDNNQTENIRAPVSEAGWAAIWACWPSVHQTSLGWLRWWSASELTFQPQQIQHNTWHRTYYTQYILYIFNVAELVWAKKKLCLLWLPWTIVFWIWIKFEYMYIYDFIKQSYSHTLHEKGGMLLDLSILYYIYNMHSQGCTSLPQNKTVNTWENIRGIFVFKSWKHLN